MKAIIAKIVNTRNYENLNSYIPGLGDDLRKLFEILENLPEQPTLPEVEDAAYKFRWSEAFTHHRTEDGFIEAFIGGVNWLQSRLKSINNGK